MPSPHPKPAPDTVDVLRTRITATTMRLFSAASSAERCQILTVLGGLHRQIADQSPHTAPDSLRQAFMFDLLADAERAAVIRSLTFYTTGDLPPQAERALLGLTITGDRGQRVALLQQLRDGLLAADADDPATQAVDALLVGLRTGPAAGSRSARQAFTPPRPTATPTPDSTPPSAPARPGRPVGRPR